MMADLTGPQIQEGKRAWDDFEGTQEMRQWDPEDYNEVKKNWAWRRPTIYNSDANTVYVGQPGTHHENVAEEFELGEYAPEANRRPSDEMPQGWVEHGEMPPGIASWHHDYSREPVGFYYKEPPEVTKALRKHFGFDPEKTQWNFPPGKLPMDPDPIDQSGIRDMHPGIQSKRSRWDRYSASSGCHG